MQLRDLIQELQDALSEQLQLTTFITDKSGKLFTNYSHLTPLTRKIIDVMRPSFRDKIMEYDEIFKKIERPIVIDSQVISHLVGLKLIVAPLFENGIVRYYFWAGVFIEQGYKALITHNEQFDWELKKLVEDSDEQTFIQVGDQLQKIKAVTSVMEGTLSTHNQQQRVFEALQTVSLIVENSTPATRIKHSLNTIMLAEPDLDFVAFAKRKAGDFYEVVDACGVIADKMVNLQFTIKNSNLLDIVQKEQFFIYSDPAETLSFFELLELNPKLLFGCGIYLCESAEGLIFGGSIRTNRESQILRPLGTVLQKTLSLLYKVEEREGALDRHLMRMSSLLEMGEAMFMVKNEEEVLNMLVDIALDLIPGEFCFALTPQDFVFKTRSISDLSIDTLKSRFYQSSFKHSPILLETEFGNVLQYPISYRKKELGIVFLHLSSTSSIKEAEVILARLIKFAAEALLHFGNKQQNKDEENTQFINQHGPLLEGLTVREIDVLHQLAKGYSNREIAETLTISTHTVKNHISNIFQKIGVSDRAQLIAMVYQLNTMSKKLS